VSALVDEPRKLWAHQALAVEKAKALFNPLDPQASGFALLMDPGVGKTGTAIHILRGQMNSHKRFLRTLILCPPIVRKNWVDELLLNSKIPRSKITILDGSGKHRLKTFLQKSLEPHIFISNFEALLMPDLYRALQVWQIEAFIADESHKLKSYSAKRSKLAERLANAGPVIPYKQILTGTPVLKDPMDLYQQFLILDGGRTLGGNFFAFRARFFRDRNAGMPKQSYFPRWETMTLAKDGYDALADLNQLIGPRSISVKKADCLDLPPLVRTTIKVPMSDEQARLYAEMKRDFITTINDKTCLATLAIVKGLRLQQICSGYIKTTDGEETTLEATPKMDALRELLETITPTGRVLVWACWRNNYEQIRQVCLSLGLGYVEIHGEVSEKDRDEAVRKIRFDPDTRVLIGHPGSGGIGLNLVEAQYSIFYSRIFPWSTQFRRKPETTEAEAIFGIK
jgi:SNF2 family DNA or RNA helicase